MVFCSFIFYLNIIFFSGTLLEQEILDLSSTFVVGGKMSPKDVLDYLNGPNGINQGPYRREARVRLITCMTEAEVGVKRPLEGAMSLGMQVASRSQRKQGKILP